MSTLNVKDSSGNWKEIPSIGGYTIDEVNKMVADKASQSEVNTIKSTLASTMKTYTKLLDTDSSGMAGTKTLSDSMMNYKYILVLVQYGSSYAIVPMNCPPKFLRQRYYDASHRMVMSTDSLYYSIYFPSNTTVTLNDSNLGSQSNKKMVIYGIN